MVGGGTTAAAGAGSGDGGATLDRRLPGAVFAALVAACFVAFFLTQHLKHTPTAVQAFKLTPFFSPTPSGHIKEERISFKLARADKATVTIVDSSGDTVATLVRDLPVARYKQLSLRWNGRRGTARRYASSTTSAGGRLVVPRNTGGPAPAGEYRVRVYLHDQRRSVLSPRNVTLVRP
ncbi:MAG TPA: hypothetical protein VL988_07915 [Solirubrobacteraceae bacterium]|nr:hypothetical protein [Solirubrobacteraceae bacterium]